MKRILCIIVLAFITMLGISTRTLAQGPTPTPTPVATPTPGGNVCTPSTTLTEGDLFPGGLSSFGVSQ